MTSSPKWPLPFRFLTEILYAFLISNDMLNSKMIV
jgi:hypothetical protein